MEHHSRIYCWLCKVIYRMWTFEAWRQTQATGRLQRVQAQERQTDRIAQLDTQQVQAVVAPSQPPQRTPGPTTNMLRKYTLHKDARPGEYLRFYKVLAALGMVERRQ